MQRLTLGMTVHVISGANKGKRGNVVYIDKSKKGNTIVGIGGIGEHVKRVKMKGSDKFENKTVIKAIDASNVMPISEKTNKPTRVKIVEKNNKRIRTAKDGSALLGDTFSKKKEPKKKPAKKVASDSN